MRMADLAQRERAIKRETAEIRRQTREIDRQIRASERRTKELQRAARAQQLARERTAGRVMAGAGRVVSSTAGVLGAGLRTVGGIATIGGTIAAGSAVRTQMDELAMASTLASQAGSPEVKGELLREAQSIEGFTGAEVLGALEQFASLTGDLDAARQLMADLGQFALATGTRLEDAAAAAGNFANNLDGIEDPGQRATAIMEAMRALGGQGMAGAVEIKDLAGGGATLGAVASQMAGDPLENIKKAGVLAQAARARGGAASPAEALTAVARFTDQLAANADKLEKLGVRVGTRDSAGNLTELADPRQVIADILEKTGGDIGKINELLGIYGQKVVRGFAGAFRERGRQGVFAEFDRLMQTELTSADIQTRAASRLEDPDVRLKETLKEFNREIGEELVKQLPELTGVIKSAIPAFKELTIGVIKVAKFFGENPFVGIGAVVLGAIAKEIAAAGIGAAVRAAITAAVGGSAAGAAASSAAGAAAETAAGAGAGKAAGKRGLLSRLGKGKALGGALAGAASAPVAVAAGGLLAVHELSPLAQETARQHVGIFRAMSTSMNFMPYAAPGLIPAEAMQSEEKGPLFRKIRDEGVEGLKDAAETHKQAAALMERAAEKMHIAVSNTIAERSSPMSKR